MSSEKKEKQPLKDIIGPTELLFFSGLGLSGYGIYALFGNWWFLWVGIAFIAAAYRAP